jgi:PAS domain S-box-containing protein
MRRRKLWTNRKYVPREKNATQAGFPLMISVANRIEASLAGETYPTLMGLWFVVANRFPLKSHWATCENDRFALTVHRKMQKMYKHVRIIMNHISIRQLMNESYANSIMFYTSYLSQLTTYMNTKSIYDVWMKSLFIVSMFAHSTFSSTLVIPTETYNQSWRFSVLSQEFTFDGISFIDIAYTSNEIVWIITSNGLIRYDGFTYQWYENENGVSLKNLHCIHVTKDGIVWMGGTKRLIRYDGMTFRAIQNFPDLENWVIKKIQEDQNGTIWILCTDLIDETKSLVLSYNGDEWIPNPIPKSKESSTANSLYIDQNNTIYIQYENNILSIDNDWKKFNWILPKQYAHIQITSFVLTSPLEYFVGTNGSLFFHYNNEILHSNTLSHPIDSMISTSYGSVLMHTMNMDGTFTLHEWNGESFKPISSSIHCQPSVRIYFLRQSPDGSIWCGGVNWLVRWGRDTMNWTEFQHCPPPVCTTQNNETLFIGSQEIAIWDHTLHKWKTSMDSPRLETLSDSFYRFHDRSKKLITISKHDLQTRTGIQYIYDFAANTKNKLYICGINHRGDVLMAEYYQDQWKIHRIPQLQHRHDIRLIPDYTSRMLVLYQNYEVRSAHFVNHYSCLRISGDQVKEYSLDLDFYDGEEPCFFVDTMNRLWVGSSYYGLYRVNLNDGRIVASFPLQEDYSIIGTEGKNGVWFALSSKTNDQGKIINYHNRQWIEYSAILPEKTVIKSLSNNRIILSSVDGYYLIDETAFSKPQFCILPSKGIITHIHEDSEGQLWFYVEDDQTKNTVYCISNRSSHPDTTIQVNKYKIQPDNSLQVSFYGMERFVGSHHWKNFLYSYRIDKQPWTSFQPENRLSIAYSSLSSGIHSIHVRSMNQEGLIDLSPAMAEFTFVSIPIQNRVWFLPVVIGIIVVIVLLAVYSYAAMRKLDYHSKNLANLVSQRTHVLQETNEMLTTLIQASPLGIMVIDSDMKVQIWNPAAENIFGWSYKDVIGNLVPFCSKHAGFEHCQLCEMIEEKQFYMDQELHRMRKDGKIINLNISAVPLFTPSKEMSGVMVVIDDISERKYLEEEVLNISEREQQRIGHELHDGVVQELTGISYLSEILCDDLRKKSPDEAMRIEKIIDMIHSTRHEVRNLARGLAPVNIGQIGLISALQTLCLTLQNNFDVHCELKCDENIEINDEKISLNLFRIAQEAATNAIRHSNTDVISIQLLSRFNSIELTISDKGDGFRYNPVSYSGMGLKIMKYRSHLLNGEFHVNTQPTHGTTVVCIVPKYQFPT